MEWISVEDELPENGNCILSYRDKSKIAISKYSNKFYVDTPIGFLPVDNVTHWMPLPEPPK